MTNGIPKSGSVLPPVLITDGAWWGSLAAVRDLGAQGVPVTLATPTKVAPAKWSRYVRSVIEAPRQQDSSTLLEWLLHFGERHPGHVIYPTSDDFAWLIAAHAQELGEFYHVSPPPLEALVQLLDKAKMVEQARLAGIDTPKTFVPRDEEELLRCASQLEYPVFIKPRVHLFRTNPKTKGTHVASQDNLVEAWRKIRHGGPYDKEVLAIIPDVDLPVVQAAATDTERIYTVNGYHNDALGLYVTVACTKILQFPRGKGPGIIFEHSELDPKLDASLRTLFRNTGFSGVFDAEFLESNGRRMLIDINPRFYNHMAFEVERGMRLPWYAYLSAGNRSTELVDAVRNYALDPHGPRVYVHRVPTKLLLLAQTLSGGMTSAERQRWWSYVNAGAGASTNPSRTKDDPKPQIGEIAMLALGMLKHPRSSLRNYLYRPR